MTKDGDYYRALSMLYALHNQPKYDQKLMDASIKTRYKKARELNKKLDEETKQKLEEDDD